MTLENAIPKTSARGADASSCAVCGGDTREEVARPASTYASPGTYRVATCLRCGSGQTMPRPDMAELDAFYSKEYKYDAHLLIEGEKRWRSRQILDHAMPSNAKRVLDIGCMYGYLLEEARARGVRDVVGIELSAGPAKAARERGLDVFCGTVEAYAAQRPEGFDLIVAQHVLEHVLDPASFLKTTHALLKPGGVLCVCVPNFDARARRVFREAWGWYQVPVHLHHFGERGLSELLEGCSFEEVRAAKRGGDSLFVLLTLLQSVGRMPKSDEAASPGAVGKALVRTASTVLRPYYFLGDDELMVVARPTPLAN
jgi:SAM-dependent methyltransferase